MSIAVKMSKDSDAGGPDAEDLVTYPVTPIAVSKDSETIEPVSEDSQTSAPVPEEPVQQKPVSMHWLVRVAERAGLEGDRPTVPPDVNAKEAWPVVTRAYELSDDDLCKLVATYFRLDVADFAGRDQNAPLLVPEAMARRHHVYPLYERDRHLLVATCDPTQV